MRISTSNVQLLHKNDTVLRVELQVEGEIGIDQLKKVFVEAGFTVTEIAETEAKELD